MPFELKWTPRGLGDYEGLRTRAEAAKAGREKKGQTKSSKAEGLFKRVLKTVTLLSDNPRHPGLECHEYDSLDHPFEKDGKVWEAYVQNNTPGAYRLFWCYGPGRDVITIIAITPHP